jgi:hypothetical protein
MAFLLFVIPNHSSGPDKANIQDGTGKGEILSHLFDVALKLVREEHVKGALGHRVHLFLSKKKFHTMESLVSAFWLNLGWFIVYCWFFQYPSQV